MTTLVDPANALAPGLAAIRRHFPVPSGFSAEVLADLPVLAHAAFERVG